MCRSQEQARVLFVSDRAEMSCAVKQNLEQGGFSFMEAHGVGDSMLRIMDGRVDAIVTDLRPQSLDPFLRSLRACDAQREVKVVVTSPFRAVNDGNMASLLGVDRYVSGPFDAESLAGRVSDALASDAFPAEPSLYKGKVLLADGSPTNTMLMTALLTELGLDVVAVQTQSEAVSQVRSNTFDVLFIRNDMPQIDAAAIMSCARECGVTAPAISVGAEERSDDAAMTGLSGHLKLPVSRTELRMTVGLFLNATSPSPRHCGRRRQVSLQGSAKRA